MGDTLRYSQNIVGKFMIDINGLYGLMKDFWNVMHHPLYNCRPLGNGYAKAKRRKNKLRRIKRGY